ncbi:putative phage replication protein [Candidatus Regiella insecticola LSR1]|uniref:Putative phage replication protein n=1 Tax=Candidatus Regiella insecticola LSR1 TaxID=663321 RepID=E0WV65_9ENTR|nr:putative phage replication protein [Candidatus Regiella insecticola]EFL91099.1 putative phage replication protein [Candidatus Regiella insecticola LSR1]
MTRYLLPLPFYYRQGKKKIMTPPAVEFLQPTAYLGHAPFCWLWNAPMKSVNHYRMETLPPAPLTPVLKSKGTPTGYLTKYVSKNLDGSVLKSAADPATGEPLLSHETGKPLHEAVEHVVAWASLHRVRQFQFFGIPSRQTYRELRLLAGQLQRKSKTKKRGNSWQIKRWMTCWLPPMPGVWPPIYSSKAGCWCRVKTILCALLMWRRIP